MSSHREAPEISKDPVADNADVYAFVSPDAPDTVTILTNFVPLQDPPGGPNFFEFGDDVVYSIYIDNDGDGIPEIAYQFSFETQLRNPDTFLYNTGQISSLDSPNWNKRQFYSVTRVDGPDTTAYGTASANGGLRTTVLAEGLASPPCNIGPRSTPDYTKLAKAAIHNLPSGEVVFAGQRNDGFLVDLGAVFDLGDLRPFQNLHLIPSAAAPGVDATKTLNIHTIALQVPIERLTATRSRPKGRQDANSVIGVWSAASRRKVRIIDSNNDRGRRPGPGCRARAWATRCSTRCSSRWASRTNGTRSIRSATSSSSHVEHPELANLLPVLYPGVFPKLAGINAARADLVAILLTGIPWGLIPDFQNYTGPVLSDQLRLNVAIPPTAEPNPFGLLGGDLAGFPNARRVVDDVVSIELRAIAGVTYPLVDNSYK